MSSLVHVIALDAELVLAVRSLEPRVFGALIGHVGLEDCGDLLALATQDQLRAFADDDLWHVAEGDVDETLNADRFATWLEVLLESGSTQLGETLASMEEDVLAHAFAQHLHVFDLETLAPMMTGDDSRTAIEDSEIVEKLLDATLTHEMRNHLLVSRRSSGWDALLEGLHALDAQAPEAVLRLLDRLKFASLSKVTEEGLHAVLSEAEQLADDALGERELRRESRGFVSPPDARAFLELAAQSPDEVGRDPISQRYLQRYSPANERSAEDSSEGSRRLAALLAAHEVTPKTSASPALGQGDSPLRAEMRRLSIEEPTRHGRWMVELGFLINVLRASSAADEQDIVSLVQEVLAIADRGYSATGPTSEQSMLTLFGTGWNLRKKS